MRILPLAILMATGLTLAACKDEAKAPPCTEAQAQAKVQELTNKMMALAASDPQKLSDLSTKLEEIARKAQSSDATDLSAACQALDEMNAELG